MGQQMPIMIYCSDLAKISILLQSINLNSCLDKKKILIDELTNVKQKINLCSKDIQVNNLNVKKLFKNCIFNFLKVWILYKRVF
jgi:flagellar hook assembly protein FlgD